MISRMKKELMKEIRNISINICDLVLDNEESDHDVIELLEILSLRINKSIKYYKK